MSAKILMGLSEENPELEKQIGCMTGIFQVFDRHHLLTVRRLTGHGHKRLSSGHSPLSDNNEDHIPSSPKINVLEYNPTKYSKENRRASFESSPCRSSSYSSLPNMKPSEIESKSTKGDIRDVVKDSINVETRALSVKTSVKNEVNKKENVVFSRKDSPRPVLSVDLGDSYRVLMRLKEQPLKTYEVPRFSCDGREFTRSKSSTKLRELPRLSLDSSEPKEMDRNSLHQRVPSIVAKLMGIEEMPNPTSQTPSESVKTNTKKSDDTLCGDSEKTRMLHSLKASIGAASDTRKVKNTTSKQNESVFSQIERTVKELEFSESNKDLRALKHIVDKMQTKRIQENSEKDQNLKSVSPGSPRITTPRTFESPIVIMKPAKKFGDLEGRGAKKVEDKARKSRSRDTLSEKRTDDNSARKTQTPVLPRSPRPVKPSNSSSPRVQQRNLESEKKLLPSARKQNGKVRAKPSKAQQRDNEITKREESDISLAMSYNCPIVMNSPLHQEEMLKIQDEDCSRLDFAAVTVEQPSPISVLDSPFYRDDIPLSPVKKISCKIEEYGLQICSHEITTSKLSSEIFTRKLSKIKDLVQKLKQPGSTNDDDFLSQILIASNFGSIKEITHGPKSNSERLSQTLMFDAIEEILARKVESVSHGPQPFLFIQVRNISERLLLTEVCSEIKQLLARRLSSDNLEDDDVLFREDLMKRSDGWDDFGIEVPGLVLEIERMIFKDLIDEVVTGVADSGMQDKANRRPRQLV